MEKRISELALKYQLTSKEKIVFRHLAHGFVAREISEKENITYETARWYIKQIYQKTGINKQAQIIRLFYE